jgi:hypothetical protein
MNLQVTPEKPVQKRINRKNRTAGPSPRGGRESQRRGRPEIIDPGAVISAEDSLDETRRGSAVR